MWQTELVTVVGQLRLIRSLFGPFRCMPFDQNTRTPHENTFVIHSVQKSQSHRDSGLSANVNCHGLTATNCPSGACSRIRRGWMVMVVEWHARIVIAAAAGGGVLCSVFVHPPKMIVL